MSNTSKFRGKNFSSLMDSKDTSKTYKEIYSEEIYAYYFKLLIGQYFCLKTFKNPVLCSRFQDLKTLFRAKKPDFWASQRFLGFLNGNFWEYNLGCVRESYELFCFYIRPNTLFPFEIRSKQIKLFELLISSEPNII